MVATLREQCCGMRVRCRSAITVDSEKCAQESLSDNCVIGSVQSMTDGSDSLTQMAKARKPQKFKQ